MSEKLLVQFSEILLGATAIIGIAIILAASWYDLKAITRKKLLQNIPNRLRQPFIVILVYAHNNETTLVNCLQSITAGRYPNYQLIICDNASNDQTKQVITAYKQDHKELPLTIYSSKIFTSRPSILRLAYKKAPKNDLVLVLNATDTISANTLSESATWFAAYPQLQALRLRLLNTIEQNVAALPLRFIELSKNTINKALGKHTVSKRNYTDSGVITRSIIINEDTLPKNARTSYASTIWYASPSHSRTNPLYHSRKTIMYSKAFASLLITLIISYFLYTAATLQSSTFLTLSWLLATLWLISVIWSDDILPRKKKFELSTTVPFMYFMFYASQIVYLCGIIWHIINTIPTPKYNFMYLYDAIQLELYSTRY